MGYGEFSERIKKEKDDSKKEKLDEDEDQKLFEKVRRMGLMTSVEKRELLKQLKEKGDSPVSLNGETKEIFKGISGL